MVVPMTFPIEIDRIAGKRAAAGCRITMFSSILPVGV
jgi:hypothetical protein